jgi:mono/diheme cytochrome c family protein
MPLNKTRSTHLLALLTSVVFLFGFSLSVSAQDQYAAGEKVFKANCASCHKVNKDMTGPALQGAKARWDGKGDIYAWIKNSQAYLKTGNEYANNLYEQWNQSIMTPMALTDEDIDNVLFYVDNWTPPVEEAPVAVNDGVAKEDGSSTPWIIVLLLFLAIVVLSLTGVKRSLRSAARAAEGLEPVKDKSAIETFKTWASNNKGFAGALGLVATCFVIVQLWNFAFNIGVYGGEDVEHYRPEQPIAFDHSLHAGTLEINCQYCHSSASKSKHSGIPSTNICMNCHKAVNEGKSAAGTAEIQKIYDAVGWDGKAFTGEENPVKWVKVHNLPDHVYFNHSQHVVVGKLECQECHGPVEEMTVAEQWAPLTMGWCIQCHGEKKVRMDGNGYYDEVEHRLMSSDMGHEELKKILEGDGKITVKDLGGWECAKCHY